MNGVWAFKVVTGVVNVYCSVPRPADEFIAYIQKGRDGEMLPFTSDTFIEMLGDEGKRAMQWAHYGEWLETVRKYNSKHK